MRFLPKSKYLFLLGLALSFAVVSNAQLRQLFYDTSNENSHIKKLSFYTPAEGYIASTNKGFPWVGFTADSGHTITKKFITNSNVNYNGYSVNLTFGFSIAGVKAFNRDSVIAYGDYGAVPAILYSTDAGNSFKLIFHSQYAFHLQTIADMIFPENNDVGYAVDGDRILKTTNKGVAWSAVSIQPSSNFNALEATDNKHVIAFTHVTMGGTISRTTDGINWTHLNPPGYANATLGYSFFISADKGWAISRNGNGEVYYTTDGGSSWRLINDPIAAPFTCTKFKFTDDSTGYAIGELYDVYKTTDSGKVWERLPRDNQFSYLYYGLSDIQNLNSNTLWVGGAFDFLEISNNGGGLPFPSALFRYDTTNYNTTHSVQLINHSKPNPGYTYQWFVNGVPRSTSYHYSYSRNVTSLRDTVMLVATNSTGTDTAIQYLSFNPLVTITSFSPAIGAYQTTVTITGTNFTYPLQVYFGGVRAYSVNSITPTQIVAMVGNGASGAVSVVTGGGYGTLDGFTYFAPPAIDLPVTVSKKILCKSEPVTIIIGQSEANVTYDLLDSLGKSYGSASGNGGVISINTKSISRSGRYVIQASRTNVRSVVTFADTLFLLVEHTRSDFSFDRVNINPNETVNYYQRSTDAQSFEWTFNTDASSVTSTIANPGNIFYTATGQKNITLISTSPYGCKDTLSANSVFVYNKPVTDLSCYAQTIKDTDVYYYPATMSKIALTNDNGYIISGMGSNPVLNSQLGNAKKLAGNGITYLAKYSTDGVLSWYAYIKSGDKLNSGGKFNAVTTDNNGNIYVAGQCNNNAFLFLNSNDSIQITKTNLPVCDNYGRVNGFVMKLDPVGNLLWHSVLEDGTPCNTGYPADGGLPTCIAISGGRILLGGTFLANLSYNYNGTDQKLVTLQNSTAPLTNTFVISLKDNGAYEWSSYNEYHDVNQRYKVAGVGLDESGNAYILGGYELQVAACDVQGPVFTLRLPEYHPNSYLMKVDKQGRYLWHAYFTDADPKGFAVDPDGTTYVSAAGTAGATSSLQINNSDRSITSTNIQGYEFIKFNANGKSAWCVGTEKAYIVNGNAVTRKGNKLFITGNFANYNVTSAPFVFTSTDGSRVAKMLDYREFFLATYDTAGVLQTIANSGTGSQSFIVPNHIAVDQNNQFLISGVTNSSSPALIFGSSIVTDRYESFFAKINADYCTSATGITAQAGADRTMCAGDSTQLGVADSGNSYYWTSSTAGFTATTSNPMVHPTVTTSYYLTVVNQAGLIARDTVEVKVLPGPGANAGSDQTICTGSTVSIGTAAITGNTYSWSSKPAGFVSASADPTVSPSVTTSYYVTVAGQNGCSSRDTVIISVAQAVTAAVSITGQTAICSGAPATFQATPVNGGTAPVYQWQVNGAAQGTNSPVFQPATLSDNDKVKVLMTSSMACASPAPAVSNVLSMAVTPSVTPSVTISNTSCTNQSTTFTASALNGGNSQLLEWYVNSARSTTTGPSLTLTNVPDGTTVYAKLTSSATCANPKTVTSNIVTINCLTTSVPAINGLETFDIAPNPTTGNLFVKLKLVQSSKVSFEVVDNSGKVIYTMPATVLNGSVVKQIDLRDKAQGVYFLRTVINSKTILNKIVISR